MVRILRDPNTKGVGAPRGTAQGVSAGVAVSGGAVPKDTVGRSGIRRLIARDPSKGVSANIGTSKDVLGGFREGAQAFVNTAMAGPNNDMIFQSRVVGVIGNSTRVRIVVAGNNTPLTVAVVGADITVNAATGAGGAVTSTASAVIAALNANAAVMALLYPVVNLGADTGAGVVAAFGYLALAGGADSVMEGVNSVPVPNPTIVKAPNPRNSTPTHKSFLNRSANRRMKKS